MASCYSDKKGLLVEGESERGHADLLLLGMRMKKEREELASLYIRDGRQKWHELFTFLLSTYSWCFKKILLR